MPFSPTTPPTVSIQERFLETCHERPEQTAILTDGKRLDFQTIERRSRSVAAHLLAGGVRKGDRIALYSPNSPDYAVAYLGIVRAQAVVVPLNILLGAEEIRFILEDAGASGLFYAEAFSSQLPPVTEGLTGLRLKVSLGAALDEPGHEAWEAVTGHPAAPWHELEMDPVQDLAAIIYTSGTTGRPKGAMLTHRNLVANTASVRLALQLRPGEDRLLVVLPMFHSFAATVGMLTPLLHGASLVPLPRFEPGEVATAIARHQATIFLGVPSMYNLLLRLSPERSHDLDCLRLCVSGGAAMPAAVMERFESRFGCPIHEGDGPTECSPVTCLNPLNGPRKPGSVGTPVPFVEMAILDDSGRSLAAGETGEIAVRGPNVMKGYWNNPQATRKAFYRDWFRTGDMGHRDQEGYFYIVDRKKDMIIVNGMNVYPRMVEEMLYRHPAIQDAAVVGEPHPLHGEIPVAFVVLKEGETQTASDLRGYCRRHLGPHQVPRKVFFLAGLPRNASGKVLKRELRRHGELERGVDNRLPGDP